MSQSFYKADLRGRSFKDQDFSGADFSFADVRGVDFTNATLKGANFSQARAGLQDLRCYSLIAGSLILSFVAGLDAAYGGASVAVLIVYRGLQGLDILFGFLALTALASFGIVTTQRGWGAEIGGLAVVLATAAAFVAAVGTSEAIANAVVQALAIAGTVAGVLTAALSTTVSRMVAAKSVSVTVICLALLGAVIGTLLGIPQDNTAAVIVGLIAGSGSTLALIALSIYAANRAITGDSRYTLIRTLAIAICSAKGTSFRNANLTDSNFTQAVLEHCDFRGAILKNTDFSKAKKLQQARTYETYLENLKIRELIITKDGRSKDFDHCDLRGLNLQQADLMDASFIGADLSEANLQEADLSRAKLVRTQLYRTNLIHSCLTGAYIQDWAISTDTILSNVRCDYIYMRLPTSDDPDPWRKPDNRHEVFKEEDFSDFIAPIVKTLDLYRQQNVDPRQVADTFKTLDLYHYEGIDPSAAAIALKQLAERHPEAGLKVVTLEGRGEEKIRLQARVTGIADQSQLNAEYFEKYREISSLPYNDLQALLAGIAEKDERIHSLETMVMTAIKSNKSYIETYYSLGDTVSEKSSINIEAGGNIGNVSGVTGGDISGVLNLGTISGNVTNAINQLPDSSNPDEPGIKELLSQLQAAIEAEPELVPEDKAEALEQVKVLAEAGQKPEDGALQKAAKTAMKILKGTVTGLPEVTKLVQESAKLLPAIVTLLALV